MIKVQLSQIEALAPDMVAQYRAAFGSPNVADILAKYGISENPLRICHFLAQILTETGGLVLLRESLNYSPERLRQVWPSRFPTPEIASEYAHNEQKLGNFVYGGRLGNINPGDGYLYRGRGLLQITGRNAYARFGTQINIPLVAQPDLAFDPAHCLEIAAAEWAVSGVPPKSCNELADADDVKGVTRAINGGQIGLNDRIYWLQRTKKIWLATGVQAEAASMSSHAQALSNGAGGGSPAAIQSADMVDGHAADGKTMNAQEALLYGSLVQAAYTMYKLNPGNLTPPQSSDFPPSYRLVAWVNMQDFILQSGAPIFYGFVAQSVTDATQFVLALRGTSNGEEWWDDANAAVRTPFEDSRLRICRRGICPDLRHARSYRAATSGVDCRVAAPVATRSRRPCRTDFRACSPSRPRDHCASNDVSSAGVGRDNRAQSGSRVGHSLRDGECAYQSDS